MPKKQPIFILGVDWNKPITRGLVSACPLGQHLQDYAAKTLISNTGDVQFEARSRGAMRRFAGGTTKVLATPLTTHATQRTYVWRSVRLGAGGGNLGRIFDKRNAGVEVEEVFFNTNALNFSRLHSVGEGRWSFYDELNAELVYALSYDSSDNANAPTVYVNGAQVTVTQQSGSSGTPLTNTDAYHIGNRGNLQREWNGTIGDFLVFDRLLNPSEMRSITQDPWQVFRVFSRPAMLSVSVPAPPNLNRQYGPDGQRMNPLIRM